MQLHNLQRKTKNKKSRMIGRGSKRGKTSGRGGKGQTARAGHNTRPEIRDFIKRLPKLRGRGVAGLRTIQQAPVVIDVADIEKAFVTGAEITPKVLVEKGVINSYKGGYPIVKILSDGEITKKVSVSGCLVSAGAKAKIEKAGGSVKA